MPAQVLRARLSPRPPVSSRVITPCFPMPVNAFALITPDSGRGCRSPGYEEFNPAAWPSACGPNKEDWIEVGSHECTSIDREWGNLFWNCADIALTSCEHSTPPRLCYSLHPMLQYYSSAPHRGEWVGGDRMVTAWRCCCFASLVLQVVVGVRNTSDLD